MPDLNFKVEGAEPLAHAAAPGLVFKLAISATPDGHGADARPVPAPMPAPVPAPVPIATVALRCQVRIEPARRRYRPGEQERLLDLFGTPDRWGQTLRSLLWVQTGLIVPAFTGHTAVDLPIPCSFDFNLAATKYFYALEDDAVPLTFFFSGSVFHVEPESDRLQVIPISWDKEASFRLPISVWKEMMELYYPNSAFLCLRRDLFDQLYLYKSRHGLPTWEQALERLLEREASTRRGEP